MNDTIELKHTVVWSWSRVGVVYLGAGGGDTHQIKINIMSKW